MIGGCETYAGLPQLRSRRRSGRSPRAPAWAWARAWARQAWACRAWARQAWARARARAWARAWARARARPRGMARPSPRRELHDLAPTAARSIACATFFCSLLVSSPWSSASVRKSLPLMRRGAREPALKKVPA